MSKIKSNFQDIFLSQMKRDKVGVVVYLVNGVQLKGTVRAYDNFTLFLENEGRIQMVYKHSITTISPIKYVKVSLQQSLEEAVNNEESVETEKEA